MHVFSIKNIAIKVKEDTYDALVRIYATEEERRHLILFEPGAKRSLSAPESTQPIYHRVSLCSTPLSRVGQYFC
jgi:hypothetical protein